MKPWAISKLQYLLFGRPLLRSSHIWPSFTCVFVFVSFYDFILFHFVVDRVLLFSGYFFMRCIWNCIVLFWWWCRCDIGTIRCLHIDAAWSNTFKACVIGTNWLRNEENKEEKNHAVFWMEVHKSSWMSGEKKNEWKWVAVRKSRSVSAFVSIGLWKAKVECVRFSFSKFTLSRIKCNARSILFVFFLTLDIGQKSIESEIVSVFEDFYTVNCYLWSLSIVQRMLQTHAQWNRRKTPQ